MIDVTGPGLAPERLEQILAWCAPELTWWGMAVCMDPRLPPSALAILNGGDAAVVIQIDAQPQPHPLMAHLDLLADALTPRPPA